MNRIPNFIDCYGCMYLYDKATAPICTRLDGRCSRESIINSATSTFNVEFKPLWPEQECEDDG